MAEMIVTCAGCGKRYKGCSGPKKFKCTGCSNLLTYPDDLRVAAEGRTFCSHCWSETDHADNLESCPTCTQKISPKIGGRAIPFATASGSSQRMASVSQEEFDKQAQVRNELETRVNALHSELAETARVKQELEAKVSELLNMITAAQSDHAMRRMDYERALKQLEEARAETKAVRGEMDKFREAAVYSIEPLAEEYNCIMKKVMLRSEDLNDQMRQAHEDINARMTELRDAGRNLQEYVDGVRREFGKRLATIIGAEVDFTPAPIPRESLKIPTN